MINSLLSNKNNPDEKNTLRIGEMYFERDFEKSFIANIWNTLQTGIRSTVLPNLLLPDELDVPKDQTKSISDPNRAIEAEPVLDKKTIRKNKRKERKAKLKNSG